MVTDRVAAHSAFGVGVRELSPTRAAMRVRDRPLPLELAGQYTAVAELAHGRGREVQAAHEVTRHHLLWRS